MNNQIYIYHHLGLGDHFHCNGVVRYLLKNKYVNQKVNLFAKEKYYQMVRFMYRDLDNLTIIPITNDEKKEKDEIKKFAKPDDMMEKIGFEYFLKNKDKGLTIDMLFYKQYNINYSKRFELTYWKRDFSNEERLFKNLVKNKDYVFVHDDPSRDFIIPNENITKNYQIIRNSYEYSLFDYGKIIENAKEIHVMESSARCMIEYLNTKNSKHFLYNFIGGPWKSIPYYNKKNELIGSSKKWKILEINFKKKENLLKSILKFKF
tara:strand:+ start:3424 stop:4209 length:786 start_codon:yes stop_codon:yes gene_type:complete